MPAIEGNTDVSRGNPMSDSPCKICTARFISCVCPARVLIDDSAIMQMVNRATKSCRLAGAERKTTLVILGSGPPYWSRSGTFQLLRVYCCGTATYLFFVHLDFLQF